MATKSRTPKHSDEFDPPRRPVSERKRAANRANARKSTGPRTDEGKAISRANAWKHGMCALAVVIPGEDPAPYVERERKWQAELNPHGGDAAGYLVHRAVLHSSRLDRCAAVHDAHVAELARQAEGVEAEARSAVVDELMRMLTDDPDVAARRLRQIPEGCDALIAEWDLLRLPLIEPWHWDVNDEARASRLMGLRSNLVDRTPGPLRLPSVAIAEHREVAAKLKKNEHPDWITWLERYDHPGKHQHDLDRVDALYEKASRGRDYILARLESQVDALARRRDELVAARADGRAEATIRARFDVSDAGKLIRRYEQDAERSLIRCMREATALSPRAAEVSAVEEVKPDEAVPAASTDPARNEATEAPPRGPARGSRGPSEGGHSSPDVRRKRRRGVRKQQ